MKRTTIILLLGVLVVSLLVTTASLAAGYQITRQVVGSGGGQSTGTGYILNGAAGESIASGPGSGSSGGNCRLGSGFWASSTGGEAGSGACGVYGVYLPLLFKGK